MLNKILKSNKGFTLVEVIVVAVIVAVLALVSIQLYQGYITEARINNAENLAASAATFLQAALNSEATVDPEIGAGVIVGDGITGWEATMPHSGQTSSFSVPNGYTVTLTASDVTAQWTDDDANVTISSEYPYTIAEDENAGGD